eukprot:6174749-Pleurochrysis_carterae.AAC.1
MPSAFPPSVTFTPTCLSTLVQDRRMPCSTLLGPQPHANAACASISSARTTRSASQRFNGPSQKRARGSQCTPPSCPPRPS